MENNTTFETGATSAAVNELILYTDTTRQLAEARDKYYSFSLNSTHVLSMRMIDLFWDAVRKYKNEFWRREQHQHITEMTDTERREYCQIYANRFADWKREKELQAKQKWICYPDNERENILSRASSRSGIMKYLRERKLMRAYKKGTIRIAETIM